MRNYLLAIVTFFLFSSNTFAKVFDLSHDVNNNTIFRPPAPPFQLFIQYRGWYCARQIIKIEPFEFFILLT